MSLLDVSLACGRLLARCARSAACCSPRLFFAHRLVVLASLRCAVRAARGPWCCSLRSPSCCAGAAALHRFAASVPFAVVLAGCFPGGCATGPVGGYCAVLVRRWRHLRRAGRCPVRFTSWFVVITAGSCARQGVDAAQHPRTEQRSASRDPDPPRGKGNSPANVTSTRRVQPTPWGLLARIPSGTLCPPQAITGPFAADNPTPHWRHSRAQERGGTKARRLRPSKAVETAIP